MSLGDFTTAAQRWNRSTSELLFIFISRLLLNTFKFINVLGAPGPSGHYSRTWGSVRRCVCPHGVSSHSEGLHDRISLPGPKQTWFLWLVISIPFSYYDGLLLILAKPCQLSTRVEAFAHNSMDTPGLISSSFQHLNQCLAYSVCSTEIRGIEEGRNKCFAILKWCHCKYGEKTENTII